MILQLWLLTDTADKCHAETILQLGHFTAETIILLSHSTAETFYS